MIDFEFVSPTKIYFGRNKEKDIGRIIKSYGFKKVLLHYGGGSIKTSGLYKKVINSIKSENLAYSELGGVRVNPTRDLVKLGVKLAQKEKVDLILAVGGGSVIDSAKAIAAGYFYDGDPFDFNLHMVKPQKALPIGVILTIAAAGSEVSPSCVISDDLTQIKRGFNCDLLRPLFAVMNPELTYSVNKEQTANGIVDIISHSFERYFSPSTKEELSDKFALSLIRHVVEVGQVAIDEPNNYEARASLMLAGALSHNGLTGLGKKTSFPIHQLSHALSGMKPDIAHGAGLAALIPAWMSYVINEETKKLATFARDVFKLDFYNDLEGANIAIRKLKDFFKSINAPLTLNQLGIIKEDVPRLVNLVTENGTRVVGHSVRPLGKKDIENIFLLCL
ncbi:MAG: iron-containing alcohol dehydrogenase [Bacilli bacterium]|jgi:alcohol dehydrogenase YqhD (iron-dependent ADH family)|nr:iron-containing alcohol dehydrogenase [Erysipelotrichia bacterium]